MASAISGSRQAPTPAGPFVVANVLMLVVFTVFTALQWNDPDRIRWTAMYGSAAVACALGLLGVPPWIAPAAVGLVALSWAVVWTPGVIANVPFWDLFSTYRMMGPDVEEARELLGLLIVVGWMAKLVTAQRRRVPLRELARPESRPDQAEQIKQ